ncbi:MAG: HD domain-containing phosphohydrolase, partial [Longimicrobiales bacterium]
ARGAPVDPRASNRSGRTAPALTLLPAPNRNVPLERHRPQRESTLTPLTDLLVGLLEYYDPYYRGGSSLTRLLAVGIAEELGLGEPQLAEISLAAVLRDIGRLALGGRILSRGEAEQHSQPRRGLEWHVELTLRMLEGISLPQRVLDAVRHHHERWDGRGYPDGLAGEAIPLEARILAVADSFSAMIRPRPYRLPRRVPEAVAELERESGRQFDPAVIEAALRLMATNDLRGFGLGGRRHVILIHPFGPDATVAAVKLGTAGFLAEVAADLDMGAERLRRVPVEAVVLSGMLPVDRAARFVEELRRDSLTTSLPVLVIDADPPGTRVSLLAAGADACLGGEASFAQIAATLGGLVGQAVRERVVSGDSRDVGWKALRGDLEDFGLNWLLQMMSYHGHTAAVVIERGEEKGIVYMVDGEPHHAQTRTRSGVDALREMLAWGRGHFAVALDMKPPERTITESLMHLLLDEAVAADHGAAGIVYGAIQAEAP